MNQVQYSSIDKLLHNLAFDNAALQNILEDLEARLFSRQWVDIKIEKPVFITSLPRAGTTIILEAISKLNGIATHTYRDMPFIKTPYIWDKISSPFSKTSQKRERAHGDGLEFNEESPEAFEEIIWYKFFSKKYHQSGIDLWSPEDGNKQFKEYLSSHLKKIIALRKTGNSTDAYRYVSKNNANIARTDFIKSIFPEAIILIPLRNPMEHAISMFRQHQNFLKQHAESAFTKKYMADIGHFEFGQLHRPIQFGNQIDHSRHLNPDSLDYWLSYWINAFKFIKDKSNVALVSYEDLCENGASGMEILVNFMNLKSSSEEIINAGRIFKSAPKPRKDEYETDVKLTREALDLYQELKNNCINT